MRFSEKFPSLKHTRKDIDSICPFGNIFDKDDIEENCIDREVMIDRLKKLVEELENERF